MRPNIQDPLTTGHAKDTDLAVGWARMALDAADSAMALTKEDGTVVLVNSKFRTIFGYDGDLDGGKKFVDVMRDSLKDQVHNSDDLLNWIEVVGTMLRFSASAAIMRTGFEVTCGDGAGPVLSFRASPVGGGMAPSGVLYTIRDLTDQRRAEGILEAVADVAREVNSDLSIEKMVPRMVEIVKKRLPLDGMVIFSMRPDNQGLVLGSFPEHLMGGVGASGPLNQLGNTEMLVEFVSDIKQSLSVFERDRPVSMLPREVLERMNQAGMESLAVLPLTLRNQVLGAWVLASRKPRSYSHNDLSFLEPVSDHLATAINNATLFETTRKMYDSAIRAIAATVDLRDSYTMHHSEHVSVLATKIAREMNLSEDMVAIIESAGLVHDVGKIGIPDSILQKSGPLDPAERAVMISHSSLGATILERAGMLQDLVPLVLHHHEWYNGSGYPDKLQGDDIPLGAAILAVADAFDTMVTDRTYRRGMSLSEARQEIARCVGSQFSPEVVRALDSVLDKAIREKEPWLNEILGRGRGVSGTLKPPCQAKTLVEQDHAIESTITSKEIEMFFRIAQEMRRLLDLDDLLNHIVHILAEEMGYGNCALLIPDEKGENLVVSASIGMFAGNRGNCIPKGKGISWEVMQTGTIQNVPDAAEDRRYWGTNPEGSELYVPLEVRGKRLGVLLAQRPTTGVFRTNDVRILTAAAGHIGAALEVAQLHEKVKRAADTDALTGLLNRRSFLHSLEASIRRASYGPVTEEVAVAILDVDRLKEVNDTYGHLAGDSVLMHVADSLKAGFRNCDVVARYGGDEFVVLLPGASVESAARRVEKVIASWKGDTTAVRGNTRILVPSASFGIAGFPVDGGEARVILSVADDRLLVNKKANRNR